MNTSASISVNEIGRAGAQRTSTIWATNERGGAIQRFFFTSIRPTTNAYVGLTLKTEGGDIKPKEVTVFSNGDQFLAWELNVADINGARRVINRVEADIVKTGFRIGSTLPPSRYSND